MTFLELMQAAADELGIPQPSQIIGGQDDQSRQLLALANREVSDFAAAANGDGGWQDLHSEYTFLTEALPTTFGSVVLNGYTITGIPSTTGIVAGTWGVNGNGIPNDAMVVSVDGPTQVTINLPCTQTVVNSSITFGKAAYALPSDFWYFLEKTFWDNSYKWQLVGPISAQEKQILKYGIVASGPRRKFYIRSNMMWLIPIPTVSGQIIAYDYFSNGPILSNGVSVRRWTTDNDTYKLDEECFILGMKWRYRRSKGLDYSQESADYEKVMQRVMSRDGGERDLPLNGPTYGIRFLGEDNIPDGNFPGRE